MAAGDIVLGANQYGKAECRLVRVDRDTAVHRLTDLNVTTQLRGDFTACHTRGDNSRVVATDTQKNTVYALARQHGIASPERFLLTLGEHFVDTYPWVEGGRWQAESYAWERIAVDGEPHDHAFVRPAREVRTALVQRDGERTWVLAGLRECTVLKSTGSEFHGFPRDRFTTLAETRDRIMATSITAWWRYDPALPGAEAASGGVPGLDGLDFDALYADVRDTLLAAFADLHSLALQQTLFEMARRVLERHPVVAELRLSCPNKHHFLVDLEPFGMDNPGEVFLAADRPYGLIEAAVTREGQPEQPEAWASVPGFA